jgi:hypothetical protein
MARPPATPALVLATLGVFSLVLYWLALPAAFVGSAAFLGTEARAHAARGEGGRQAVGTAAVVLAGLTLVTAVVLAEVAE